MSALLSIWRASPPNYRPTILQIVEQVATAHGLTLNDMLSETRLKRIAHVRQAAYAACIQAGYGYAQTGRRLGRDHTTILHGDRAHRQRMALREAAE